MTNYTLYAAPFSCSLAVQIALRQYQVAHTIQWVERGANRMIKTPDYDEINPKRKVPALALPDGEILTESISLLVFIDKQHGPQRTPAQRRKLLEWLTYFATEFHKTVLSTAFDRGSPQAAKEYVRDNLLPPVLAHLARHLSERETVLGGAVPSVADAHLFWALLLTANRWPEVITAPSLIAFRERMAQHPFIRQALGIDAAARKAAQLPA